MSERQKSTYTTRFVVVVVAILAVIRLDSVLAMAIVDDANTQVNFTDISFFAPDGSMLFDLTGLDITASDGFTALSDLEVGNAVADLGGDAQACDIDTCGFVSIFPLQVDASTTADSPGLSSATAAGLAEGALTFSNNTGVDLTFSFFVEVDTDWNELRVDDPVTETAQFGFQVSFDYDGAVTMVADELLLGDSSGVTVDELCPAFGEPCNIRESFVDLLIPAGATTTLAAALELSAFAEVAVVSVAEPGTLWLLLPLLAAMRLRRRVAVPQRTLDSSG